WTTPRRPTINQNGPSSRLHNFTFESLVGDSDGLGILFTSARTQLLSTSPTPRLTSCESSFLNPVLRSTVPTSNYLHKTPLDAWLKFPQPSSQNFGKSVTLLTSNSASN